MNSGVHQFKSLNVSLLIDIKRRSSIAKGVRGIAILSFLLCLGVLKVSAQHSGRIEDHVHYSEVFGEARHFRVIVPQAHDHAKEARFPVVYFMHGWSQRYFGRLIREPQPDDAISLDDSLAILAEKHQVIIVKPDGYNANLGEDYYLRPYNIGPVETFRQFPVYIPELVNFVDTHFKSKAERGQRAISGFSMGGFMSLWLGGKYPHLFSAVGAFCASPEFVIGPRDFPVEYFHGDLHSNYRHTRVRHHYGDEDFIRAYHKDINAIWDNAMADYSWKEYKGGHEICGKAEMFSFFDEHFSDPVPVFPYWNHIDVYPNFEIWGYQVFSDREIPGFTVLENVGKHGFKSSVQRFLPDGETIPSVKLNFHTPPIYKEKQLYKVMVYDSDNPKPEVRNVYADDKGRLRIQLSGDFTEVFIAEENEQRPEFGFIHAEVDNHPWATAERKHTFRLKLFNKGNENVKNVKLNLRSTNPSVTLDGSTVEIPEIPSGEQVILEGVFGWESKDNSATHHTMDLQIRDGAGNEWRHAIQVPIQKDTEMQNPIMIADGKEITYLEKGNKETTGILGIGNGDGIPNPGESIVLLVQNNGDWRPLHLFTTDKRVDLKSGFTRFSDYWGSFDHVGGSFKFSRPLLHSKDQAIGTLAFVGTYWQATYPDHPIYSGVVRIEVEGNDTTAPQVDWVRTDKNIIQAKLFDGANIVAAKAMLTSPENGDEILEIKLNDDGSDGDIIKGDGIFSARVVVPVFGEYEVRIWAKDQFGNEEIQKNIEKAIFHGSKRYHHP